MELSGSDRVQKTCLRVRFTAGMNIGEVVIEDPVQGGYVRPVQSLGASLLGSHRLLRRFLCGRLRVMALRGSNPWQKAEDRQGISHGVLPSLVPVKSSMP